MKITVLAGGVGGAKMVDGLAKCLPSDCLATIVNTGDDFEFLSLYISPDLDTVCYTLAGMANPETGWGQVDETWATFRALANYGGPDWFHLGDRDLAVHLLRTEQLRRGSSLSQVTAWLCDNWNIDHPVFPMTDDAVRTLVHTAAGETLGFQEYFVHQACQPKVTGFTFDGAAQARPNPEALKALQETDLVLFAPSNPWVSIDPIFSVPGYRQIIEKKPVVAISPLVGGKALKGPAAKMYQELGMIPSAGAVAEHYRSLLTGFVFDDADRAELEKINRWRIIPLVTDIIMKDQQDRVRFAKEVLQFCEMILNRSR